MLLLFSKFFTLTNLATKPVGASIHEQVIEVNIYLFYL